MSIKLILLLLLLQIVTWVALLRTIYLLFKYKNEHIKSRNRTNNNINKLETKISILRESFQNLQIHQQKLMKANTLNRNEKYDDLDQCFDTKIDSIHNREKITLLSDYKEKKSEVQVNNYPNTKFIKSYNINSRLLAQKGTKVAISINSLKQYQLGSNQDAILKENRKGDYFIIRDNSFEYLFPGTSLKVNQYNLATIEKIFICHGYKSSNTGKFRLIKAAIVSSQSLGAEWVLQQPGELQFS